MARRNSARRAARRRSLYACRNPRSATHRGRWLYRRPLRFEPLEDRRLLALVTVDTLADTIDFTDGVTSLREAIFATNTVPGADTIEYAPALTAAGPATILLTQGELAITDSLTINGPGAELLTIDAQQQSRIFNITATTGDYTLSGMTITGGQTIGDNSSSFDRAYSGGAIRSLTTGHLAIDRAKITMNSTLGRFALGGGVFAIGDVWLFNSTVSGNSTSGENSCGGAIFTHGLVTANASTITGNHTAGDFARGGGIYAVGNITAVDSTISGNSTAGTSAGGGGVMSRGNVTLTQSMVAGNNTAGIRASGGGIIGDTGVLVVQSIVSSNKTLGDFALAGGILSNQIISLLQSTVSGNSTAGTQARGGGIYGPDVILTESIVSGNSTSGSLAHGGGIIDFQAGVTLIQRSVITDNHALGPGAIGGGLFGRSQRTEISGSIVAGNSAASGSHDIRNALGSLTLDYSILGDASGTTLAEAPVGLPDANGNLIGGPVHGVIDPLLGPLADNGGFELPDGSHILTHALLPGSPAINAGDLNAVAGENGVPHYDQRGEPFDRIVGGRIDIGAFEYQEPSPLNLLVDTLVDESDGDYSRGDLSLREAIELTNAADYAGIIDTIEFDPVLTAAGPATILLTQGELAITDSLTINGPGADLLTIDASGNDLTPTIKDGRGTRILNIDDGDGDRLATTLIVGLTFTGGDSNGDGGAILTRENLTLTHSTISGNSARTGGGIRTFQCDVSITNCVVSNNQILTRTGGGIRSSFGDLAITDTIVNNNVAGGPGGGISKFGGTMTLVASTVSGNVTNGRGGGVYCRYTALTISRSAIEDNTASSGGGVFNLGLPGSDNEFNLTDSVVRGNVATGVFGDGGGGIWNYGDTLLLSRSNLIENFTAFSGGGIYTYDGEVIVRDSMISGNMAAAEGGGVYAGVGTTAAIERSTVTGNATTGNDFYSSNGGGILGAYITISQSTISGNSAPGYGGGVVATALSITQSTISQNESGQNGGGIYVRDRFNAKLTLIQSTVSGNSARWSGGGAWSAAGATIRNSTISANMAELNGGGLFSQGGTITLDDSIIGSNSASVGRDLTGLLGTVIDARHSLIGSNANTGLFSAPVNAPDANGNLIGGPTLDTRIDPLLGPLADNGGFELPDGSHILTHALLPGSPAINAGDPSAQAGVDVVPEFDQRGAPFTRVYGGRIDIGAFESQPMPAAFYGDYNQSGRVDAADYTRWRDTLGQIGLAPYSGADGNGDGVIGWEDYQVWKSHFGETVGLQGARHGESVTGGGGFATANLRQGSGVGIAEALAEQKGSVPILSEPRMATDPAAVDRAIAGLSFERRVQFAHGLRPATSQIVRPRWNHSLPGESLLLLARQRAHVLRREASMPTTAAAATEGMAPSDEIASVANRDVAEPRAVARVAGLARPRLGANL